MIKARVHLILTLPEHDPVSFRTDVLCLTRDPQWAHSQALVWACDSLEAIGLPPAQIRMRSLEWVPTLKDAQQEATQ